MRQDPPFDMGYITYTHLLESIHPNTLVVNNPYEVRNAPEKLYVNQFKEFMPETIITRNIDDIKNFSFVLTIAIPLLYAYLLDI